MKSKLIRILGVGIAAAAVFGIAVPAQAGLADGYRPDGLIREKGGSLLGNNIFNDSGSGQTIYDTLPRSFSAEYEIKYENNGTKPDKLRIGDSGLSQKGGKWKSTFLKGGQDITAQIKGFGYKTGLLQPGESGKIKLKIKNQDGGAGGCECLSWLIDVDSWKDNTAIYDSVGVSLENEPI
jgi:uncharacterized membrane protein